MEWTIGNLAQEIRLHNASIYANLSQRAVRHCQVNAIKVIIPSIEPAKTNLPQGSQDLGNGYVLLRNRERTPHTVWRCESDAILQYLTAKDIHVPTTPQIIRWAQLRLPNGQVARSAWKELAMTRQPRMARNVKVCFKFLSFSADLTLTSYSYSLMGRRLSQKSFFIST
ncbi:hypothetical protein EDB19DRAFT_1634998 [Suillus lakei]|nr:hypothetical protein EDB19DRAFT_1634998 [Suillus lakei]